MKKKYNKLRNNLKKKLNQIEIGCYFSINILCLLSVICYVSYLLWFFVKFPLYLYFSFFIFNSFQSVIHFTLLSFILVQIQHIFLYKKISLHFMYCLCGDIHIYTLPSEYFLLEIPVQDVCGSPINPGGQVHRKVPTKFVHKASLPQTGVLLMHSSTS